MVALVVALSVPISQLRTISIVTECCCPDPTFCHCPDHEPSHGPQPSMRACHRTQHETVAPTLPAFTAPALTALAAPQRALPAPQLALAAPHAPPSPARPDAPS
jgi:hypothetical protein